MAFDTIEMVLAKPNRSSVAPQPYASLYGLQFCVQQISIVGFDFPKMDALRSRGVHLDWRGSGTRQKIVFWKDAIRRGYEQRGTPCADPQCAG